MSDGKDSKVTFVDGKLVFPEQDRETVVQVAVETVVREPEGFRVVKTVEELEAYVKQLHDKREKRHLQSHPAFLTEACPHCGNDAWREGRISVAFDDPPNKLKVAKDCKVLVCSHCNWIYDCSMRFYRDED